MPVLFESSFNMDKSFYKEIYSYHHFKKPSSMLSLICAVLLLIPGLYFAVKDQFQDAVLNIALIFYLFAFALYFAVYFMKINISLKRIAEVTNNAPAVCTASVTENSINYNTPVSKMEINFSNIKKAFQTKNYIMLMSNSRLIYSFRKDNFTVGNCEDFLKFLRVKGYKI